MEKIAGTSYVKKIVDMAGAGKVENSPCLVNKEFKNKTFFP